ncbi:MULTISPECIES: hypothetical protein [unclassified Nostoc]|nr:hypothetical protein [Nostoc sp. JL23]
MNVLVKRLKSDRISDEGKLAIAFLVMELIWAIALVYSQKP